MFARIPWDFERGGMFFAVLIIASRFFGRLGLETLSLARHLEWLSI
jgi:hypothetical protein